MTTLLLRPQGKVLQSETQFSAAEIDCVVVGLMDIQPNPDGIKAWQAFSKQQNAVTIVTSTNSAHLMQACQSELNGCEVFAVGTSTAKILRDKDINVITPNQQNSEGLLSLPQLNNVSGKSIAIIKGVGGRTLIPDELTKRGASVYEFAVYERFMVSHPYATREWKIDEIQCIIATSGELIEAAFKYWDSQWLIQVPWIVVSERTREIAAKLGIKQITLSAGANDGQLIQAVQDQLER